MKRLILLLVFAIIANGKLYHGFTWTQWRAMTSADQTVTKNTLANAKTYADTELVGFAAGSPFFSGGLDAKDTVIIVSPDSTDTTWMFWASDTFWIETTDSVYIAKLMGVGGACMWNDSIPQIRARLDTVEANLDTALAYIDTFCFSGQIKLWYGSVGSIPAGWQLCNGTNGTPDLRNRFVVGAGDNYVVDSIGGSTTHTHTINAENAHTHAITWNVGQGAAAGYGVIPSTSTDAGSAHTHTESTESNLPPFYALCYIMKL